MLAQATGDDRTAGPGNNSGPVVVLSYIYAGADRVQSALASGTRLACTSATGILPLCAAAADSWRRIEGQPGMAISPLATAAIRRLVSAQVMAILAGSGHTRWCELATASSNAAQSFLQVLPDARFVCVHRSCLDVVRAAVRANPWGLVGQGLAPYLLNYPGNSVAALAASWADSAEQLIAFENANRQATHRVRYEDVAAQPDDTLAAVRAGLGLASTSDGARAQWAESGAAPPAPTQPEAEVPADMIPQPLLQRISRLHAELGYPPPEA